MKNLYIEKNIKVGNKTYLCSGSLLRVIVNNIVTYYYDVGIIDNDSDDLSDFIPYKFTFTGDVEEFIYKISYQDFMYITDNLYYKQNSDFTLKFLEQYKNLEHLEELISVLFTDFTYMCQEHYTL